MFHYNFQRAARRLPQLQPPPDVFTTWDDDTPRSATSSDGFGVVHYFPNLVGKHGTASGDSFRFPLHLTHLSGCDHEGSLRFGRSLPPSTVRHCRQHC